MSTHHESTASTTLATKSLPSTESTLRGTLPAHDGERSPEIHDAAVEVPTSIFKRKWLRVTLTALKDQWFLISLGLLIAIASQVQVPTTHQHVKEITVTYLCVSIIFFITGCTLDTRTLLQNYGRWKILLFVQLQCFLMTSAVVFGLVSAVATDGSHFMDPGLLVGLLFFSCVPTTISSNVVMTRQAHGNQALTVVQTTVGNFLGVFITPALVVMYTSVDTWYNRVLPSSSNHFAQIYRRVLMQLGLSIYLPLIVGQLVRYLFPQTSKRIFVEWKLNRIASIALLLIIWQTYDQAFASRAFASVPSTNMIFIVFVGVGLWILFFGIAFTTSLAWLPKKDVVAICYCVPAKGPAMGVPLATTIFAGLDTGLASKVQIPIVIYQGLQLVFGSILIGIFRRWIEKDEQRKAMEDVPAAPQAAQCHESHSPTKLEAV